MNDDEVYSFAEEDLEEVVDAIIKDFGAVNPLWQGATLKDTCSLYGRLFPAVDGRYELSKAHIETLEGVFVDRELLKLIDMGLVEMLWSDQQGFVFRLTDTGKEYTKQLFEDRS